MSGKEDNLLIWIMSGMIQVLIFNFILSPLYKFLGWQSFYSWNLAADFILQGRPAIESLWGVIIGLTADSLIGVTNAVLIGLILELRGTRYYLLKGVGVAYLNWFILGILFQIVPQLFTYKITPFAFAFYLIPYIGMGGLSAYLITTLTKKYGKDPDADPTLKH